MDRLFLAGLVREIASTIGGARVRSVRIDVHDRSLTLALSKPGAPAELVLHLAPGAAGLYTRDHVGKKANARPREAKLEKLLASSSIESVTIAELDRVVTVSCEQTRLSGKKRGVDIVLELVAAQRNLYVVDRESGNVIDALSAGATRLLVGERYRALTPPPRAALPPSDADDLERRLARAGNATDRDTLLSATGWTPLLVKEMRQWMVVTGAAPRAAFEELRRRLEARQPVLYFDPACAAKVVASPIALTCETSLEPHPMPSFNDAMAEAIRVSVRAERTRSLRQRLGAALSRRFKRAQTLRDKLERQRSHLVPTAELRQQGETLLAGIAHAERIDDAHVRVPDPFHPEADAIDIEIDPRISLAENAERLFRRARKVERSEVELSKRLVALAHQLDYLDTVRVGLDDAGELDELQSIADEMEEQGLLPPTGSATRGRGAPKRLPPRRFTTARGTAVLVGRSARSNAELTFKMARPDDLWLHASGIPGSHVVLRSRQPDDDDIEAAAGYAAYFSKARNDAYVDVMVTERRNVSSIKGAPPGLVKVTNVRTVRVRPTRPASEDADEIG